MAISLLGTPVSGSSTSNPVEIDFTLEAGANRMLYAAVFVNSENYPVTSISYGGIDMGSNLISYDYGYGRSLSIYYLPESSLSTLENASHALSFSADSDEGEIRGGGVFCLAGVEQKIPSLDYWYPNVNSGDTPYTSGCQISGYIDSGAWVLGFCVSDAGNKTYLTPHNSNQTEIFSLAGYEFTMAVSYSEPLSSGCAIVSWLENPGNYSCNVKLFPVNPSDASARPRLMQAPSFGVQSGDPNLNTYLNLASGKNRMVVAFYTGTDSNPCGNVDQAVYEDIPMTLIAQGGAYDNPVYLYTDAYYMLEDALPESSGLVYGTYSENVSEQRIQAYLFENVSQEAPISASASGYSCSITIPTSGKWLILAMYTNVNATTDLTFDVDDNERFVNWKQPTVGTYGHSLSSILEYVSDAGTYTYTINNPITNARIMQLVAIKGSSGFSPILLWSSE